jgi:phosphatidylserine decarboxylase
MFRNWTDSLPALHREGPRFILIFAVVTAILFVVWEPLGWLGVILTLWCVYFFRDPARVTPMREGLVVSPADGIVSRIAEVPPPAELGMGAAARTRISIFMNVFDTHVNRVPVDGTVQGIAYRPGKFVNATLDKASDHNERNGIRIALEDGRDLAVVQIAGLVARRIVSFTAAGSEIGQGERIGMIRFGSRVDLYLPLTAEVLVAVGQTAVAGETVIARFGPEARERMVRID